MVSSFSAILFYFSITPGGRQSKRILNLESCYVEGNISSYFSVKVLAQKVNFWRVRGTYDKRLGYIYYVRLYIWGALTKNCTGILHFVKLFTLRFIAGLMTMSDPIK